MTSRTSVALTGSANEQLRGHLLRSDGQEDVCLATYRPSTGATRRTALLRSAVFPEPDEREVHGNASITGDYVLRAAALAAGRDEGIALCHSHPGGRGWQALSGPDRDAERSFANLVRELTGLPLVGMTLAGADGAWSARHWDRGTGTDVDATPSENVRVLGDRLAVSWNDQLMPPPPPQPSQLRSASCWGKRVHADLTRRSALVVGLGSVGLDIALRLAATGLARIGLMDFDTVEQRNLDRLVGVSPADAWLRRAKVLVAGRLVRENATATDLQLDLFELSVCEPAALEAALDYDLVFCCVDRPWPRAVLNALAYRDLIPVIDGGIAVDVFADGEGMRGATWRSHVIGPGRACMSCNGQLDLGAVSVDRAGMLDDPAYILGNSASRPDGGQNVAALSVSVAAGLLAQYISLNTAPGGLGDPGPLQYVLGTHTIEHLAAATRPTCPIEALTAEGDHGQRLTGSHRAAEQHRFARSHVNLPLEIRVGRVLDDATWRFRGVLSRLGRARLLVGGA